MMTATPTFFCLIQGVPPICLQLRTKFWKLKNHICQKISPVLKFLNKNLSDGTLKPGKIKLEVFLNLKSKKGVKSEKWFCTLPPPHLIHPHPLAITVKFLCRIWHLFLILNLKILPIWFSHVSRCHLKDFYSRISKQGLLFGICDFSIFKI